MKIILFANFFLFNFCNCLTIENCKEKYLIKIWDYNYSMAYTTFYNIEAGSVTVKFISNIKGEKDSILLKKKLCESECKMVFDFLSSHDIDHFKNKYSNSLVTDGDQKRIIMQINGKSKTIEIENFYEKNLDELFNIVNKIAGKDHKIKYIKSN